MHSLTPPPQKKARSAPIILLLCITVRVKLQLWRSQSGASVCGMLRFHLTHTHNANFILIAKGLRKVVNLRPHNLWRKSRKVHYYIIQECQYLAYTYIEPKGDHIYLVWQPLGRSFRTTKHALFQAI